jgi:hypothetical protein
VRRRKVVSTLDGLCDLLGGLGGGEVRGVDDLGLGVQPRSDRLGVGLEVLETERGIGAENGVARDARAEGVLVGRPELISRQYCSTRTVIGMRRAVSTTRGRQGGRAGSCPSWAVLHGCP